MRQSTYNVINGLEKTIALVSENTTCKNENATLLEYKKILEDPVLLVEYINKKKMDVLPFQASETFQTEVILKPWYAEYLNLYGPPGNGVFDSELLANIVINLINTGVITEEEFLNS